tara:strand:- start:374 stop:715 length:342 start_codon:yes stop_codon:yes gene_type:complete
MIVKQDLISPHIHKIILFLLSSQYKHPIIFTTSNRKSIEQWIDSIVHLYTIKYELKIARLLKSQSKLIIENIMSVFRFEKILSNDNIQQIEKEQKKILTSWNWIMRNIVKIKQ